MNLWDEFELGKVASYGKEKVDAQFLDASNYISTDNMLQNKEGVISSDYVPIDGRHSKYVKNDILVSNIRPYFKKIWFANKNGGCSNDVIVFKVNQNIADPRFLYYQLSKDEFFDFMMAGANGTKMPRGNKDSIPNFKLLLPPLPTQRRIASILSAYDDLIENNLKRIKLLEELAQRTYEEWFVKFRINGEPLPVDEMTGLPVGWERIQIGKIIKFFKGKKAIEIFETKAEGFEKLILLDGIETGNFKYTKPESQVIAKRGDLLMLMDGARSSKVFFSENGVVGSTFSKLVINNSFVDSYYLKLFFEANYETMKANNTGAAIPHANKSFINSMSIVIADKIIMENWRINSNNILNLMHNLKDQIHHLKQSRDILLPRLMSGKINVE